jgi:hypothetical protein
MENMTLTYIAMVNDKAFGPFIEIIDALNWARSIETDYNKIQVHVLRPATVAAL